MSSEFHQQFHKNTRIEAFSDGVFSIVLTLLVLDLRTPKLQSPGSSAELWQDLFTMRSQIFSFLLSFIFVIMLWVAHNIWFRTLEKTDSVVLWVNNFFLLLVCFIPFPTSLIGSYPGNSVAMIVFGTDWILIAVVMLKHCVSWATFCRSASFRYLLPGGIQWLHFGFMSARCLLELSSAFGYDSRRMKIRFPKTIFLFFPVP
jgi:uncharacterized membrane protein